jgi:glycosyltransferase involved in cell wall biosynthesis
MAKIVIDARESGTSTGRYVDKLVEHLHIVGTEHELVILTKQERVDFMEALAPNFTTIASPYKEFTFGEQLGFNWQLRELKADLVHFAMVQQPVRYRGAVVTTMHDLTTARFKNPGKNPLVFSLKQSVYKWVIKKVARKSQHIITPSEFVKQDVAQYAHIPLSKITVTLEAAEKITDPATEVGEVGASPFIMYVGRPQPHKNLDRLIDAYAQLKAQHPDLKLVIAGKKDNVMKQHEQIANTKGIKGVVFTDYITDGQLRWLYEHTAAYIFPSLSEGFGLPGLEAMVHGAPVISSNATCLPEIYGEAAIYFDPTSVEGIVSAIHEVLSDKKIRDDLIAKGKVQAAKYSWRTTALRTFDIYNKTLQI